MKNMKTPRVARAVLVLSCLAMTPFAASAQDSSSFPTRYIDVFQDGTLFITYDEYLERQRRVEAAQVATRVSPAPLAAPARRAPVVAAARASNTTSLRNQWTIGAFR